MSKIVIFGLGDIAELAHYYFTNDSQHDVVGFTVDKAYLEQDKFCGLPVVPFENIKDIYTPETNRMFIALSYARMNQIRSEKVTEAKKMGYRLVSYVSSRATVFPDLRGKENCFILEDNTIQPFVKIGNNVTLWSGNHIGHHTEIGDNTFVSSHVVISGGVKVGENCFFGVNSTVHDHLEISDYTLIAAGALVRKNTEPRGVYVGSPAKKMPTPSTALKL